MTSSGFTRREFVKLVGGGVVVFVTVGPSSLFSQQRRQAYPEDFNAYLRIGEDGRVTVFSGKIEMGQGFMTSQAQMVAEELGVPLDAIDMILGDTDRVPYDAGTWGSLTTRVFGPALRAAAAKARSTLMQLASKKLGVTQAELSAKDGIIAVAADPSKKVTYGELAKGKEIARIVDEKAIVKAAKEFQIMGRSPVRLDGKEKVTGSAKYAGDIRLPNMLHARILRPPAHGAKLAQVDTADAAKIAGTTIVNQDNIVAVLHSESEKAEEALGSVNAAWTSSSDGLTPETIFDHFVKSATNGEVQQKSGDVDAARASTKDVFESTYRHGYVAHAPMEPHTALAEWKDGKMTIWASTQSPFGVRDQVSKALGLDTKAVRVITPYVGGGFGGKGSNPQALEAARLAKIVGKPVQVAWTRAEEFFYDTFDPAAVVKIASAMNGEGKITLWDYDVWAAGDRGTDLFYDVPNSRIRTFGGWMGGSSLHPFAVGPWRAPGANMNVFAKESHIDAMAAAAKIDPLEFRLKNTSDPRMRNVLKAAADAYGWKPAAGPTGKGRGLACGIDAGSYVAHIADVSVGDDGQIAVKRVVCAQEMGIVVNPDGAKMQMEGCITMGLGYPLTEELDFEDGNVKDRNFGTYRIPHFDQVPKIETILVKNDELLPQGGGEPAIVPMGAVIANAFFDATGVRMYRLPMTKERVLEALKKKNAAA